MTDVTSALDRGDQLIALIGDPRPEIRRHLLTRIETHLEHAGVRLIPIEDAGPDPVGTRRFCQLLTAASCPDHRDPAGHLADILTSPRVGERGLALVVPNADPLMEDALDFVAHLAAASSSRPPRVQALLFGGDALESRLSNDGPFVIKRLQDRRIGSAAPSRVRRRIARALLGVVAFGCLAGLLLFGAARVADRPSTGVAHEAATQREETPPALPELPRPSSGLADASAMPTVLAGPPAGAVGSAAPEPAPDRPAPETREVAAVGTPPDRPLPGQAGSAVAETPSRIPSTDAPAAWSEPGPPSSPPELFVEKPDPPALNAAPAVAAPAASGPTSPQGETSAAEPAPAAPKASETAVPAPAPPPAPQETEAGSAGPDPAGPPLETAALPASAAAPQLAEAPAPKPTSSPGTVAGLLARGDALIATGDVATARLVYQRAAALNSGQAATATGRTYDPRFLRRIGAVGVVADPEAAAKWYRKGVALGDEEAAPLLGGLHVRAGQ